jgi:hypothetical protein
MLVLIAVYGVCAWITWKFYRALARIGEELSELKTVLHDRLPLPGGPSA